MNNLSSSNIDLRLKECLSSFSIIDESIHSKDNIDDNNINKKIDKKKLKINLQKKYFNGINKSFNFNKQNNSNENTSMTTLSISKTSKKLNKELSYNKTKTKFIKINNNNYNNYYNKKKINTKINNSYYNFSFKPKLDKNSEKINEKLIKQNITPKKRLLQKKEKYNPFKGIYFSKNIYSPYYRKNSLIENDKNKNIKSFINLYHRCKDQKILKDEKLQEERFNKIKKEMNYSFKPKLYKSVNSTPKNIKNINSKIDIINNFISNNELFIKKKKNNLVKLMKRIITENNEDITFTPKINRTISSDDINTISFEIPYINNYVFQRRSFLQTIEDKKNEEEYKIRHPFLISERKFPINIISNKKKFIKDIKYFRENSIREVLKKRKEYGVEYFFFDKNNLSFNNNPFIENSENDTSRNYYFKNINNDPTAEFKQN